jgi:hypothetical protein
MSGFPLTLTHVLRRMGGTHAEHQVVGQLDATGGEWISSVDLESALMEHPEVTVAAVIARPDERWSERPLAYVVAGDVEGRCWQPTGCRAGSRSGLESRLRPQLAGASPPPPSPRNAEQLPKGADAGGGDLSRTRRLGPPRSCLPDFRQAPRIATGRDFSPCNGAVRSSAPVAQLVRAAAF